MADTPVADSYIATIEAADVMAAKRPNSTAWTGATADQKADALQEATRRLDSLPLRGYRHERPYIENAVQKDTNSDGLAQTLEFPRIIDGVICDFDYGTKLPIVPEIVKWACLEEAIAILGSGSGTRQVLQEQGVQSYTIGRLSETFRPGAGSEVLASGNARRRMRRYIGVEVR